jgi:hypothetical protein
MTQQIPTWLVIGIFLFGPPIASGIYYLFARVVIITIYKFPNGAAPPQWAIKLTNISAWIVLVISYISFVLGYLKSKNGF